MLGMRELSLSKPGQTLSLSMSILVAFLEIVGLKGRTDIPQFNDTDLVASGSHAQGSLR